MAVRAKQTQIIKTVVCGIAVYVVYFQWRTARSWDVSGPSRILRSVRRVSLSGSRAESRH